MVVARIFFATLAIAFLAAAAPAGAAGDEVDALRSLLRNQRALEAAGGWPRFPDGPTIRPGDADHRLEALAHRLTISRDIPDDARLDISKYGGEVRNGVVRFQSRHGLDADGIVGPDTVAALNVPVSVRIRQIRANIARLESEPPIGAAAFVRVNIPAFRARLVRSGNPVWSTRVIVGEVCSQTPVFRASIRSVVVNPTWTVPHRIATEEMLPRIQADPAYLSRNGYDLLDMQGRRVAADSVDWASAGPGRFPFVLVQRPGPGNELGRIKFMIPNEYDVQMHDTPSKALFERPGRAYSHGCIRVEDPVTLAALVLDGTGWTKRGIGRAIRSNETKTIRLQEPLPVIVVYRTVEIDEQGVAHFYNDIYERDADPSGSSATP